MTDKFTTDLYESAEVGKATVYRHRLTGHLTFIDEQGIERTSNDIWAQALWRTMSAGPGKVHETVRVDAKGDPGPNFVHDVVKMRPLPSYWAN